MTALLLGAALVQADLDEPLVLRIYDMRDLLFAQPRAPFAPCGVLWKPFVANGLA